MKDSKDVFFKDLFSEVGRSVQTYTRLTHIQLKMMSNEYNNHYSLTHYSFTHLFIPSVRHSFTPSFPHSLIPSFIHSFIDSPIPYFTHSFIHLFLIHSLII